MELCGVLELVLPLGDHAPEAPEARLMADSLTIPGHASGDRTMRFRFCPKAAKTYEFAISSHVPALDGKTGGIKAVAPEPEVAEQHSPNIPHWWTDNPAPGSPSASTMALNP